MSRLVEVRTEIVTLSAEQMTALKAHEGKEIPADDLPAFVARNEKLNELKAEYDRLQEQSKLFDVAGGLHKDFNTSGTITHGTTEPQTPMQREAKTLGDRFLADEGYQHWFKQMAPQGRFTEKSNIISPPVEFKDLVTGASDTSAGAFVFNDVQNYANLLTMPRRPLTMRQIITNGTTDSDTVEYVRATSETNNAAPVAEATATAGGSGVKPESALAYEKVTTTVKTIAHWIAASTRALSDAGQMRTLIDGFLRSGLDQELEDQMISGDGTGENFTGLEAISGVLTQAWSTDLLTTARKARTNLRLNGRVRPNAFLLNPADWERFDLETDGEERYYFGGPMQMGTPTLWGVPVVESEGVTSGTGWLGDFKYLVLWDRQQGTITVSNSHADFFIRNLVAILAELRAAFGCLRPTAFVEIDLTA